MKFQKSERSYPISLDSHATYYHEITCGVQILVELHKIGDDSFTPGRSTVCDTTSRKWGGISACPGITEFKRRTEIQEILESNFTILQAKNQVQDIR